MTDNYKKKKLLADNTDLYISDNDKNLSYDALSRIITAKRDYNRAKEVNDTKTMKLANDAANSVRSVFGNYTAGSEGNEYFPVKNNFELFPYSYKSDYDDDIDREYRSLGKSKKFSYNYEDDPSFKAYKEVYEKEGDLAYDRAMGDAMIRTGGAINTNALSAANQAQNYYSSLLAAKIPELYKAAYERYQNDRDYDYNAAKDRLSVALDRDKRTYDRYRDDVSDFQKDRYYFYTKGEDYLNREAKRESDEENLFYNIFKDALKDNQWENDFRSTSIKNLAPLGYGVSRKNIDILEYVRKLFGNNAITQSDLYNLLGL